MSKKKKQQSTTMEDHSDVKECFFFFDKIDYEVSSILLELSHLVGFSSDSPFLPKWGRTQKRCKPVSLNPPEISPVLQSPPCTEVGSTSSSSCLTGEAKKTNPQSIKRNLEVEFCTKNQRSKKPNSVLESEMGLSRAQVGLLAHQPISDQNLQPLICVDRTVNVRDVKTASLLYQEANNLKRRCFDLNFPAAEEGDGNNINSIATIVGFERVVTKDQAAQARQRRLGLIRSKKFYSRFISTYQ